MKVLIIGSRIPWPLRDGGAIATYNLLKGLSEAGVEVSFLSLNTNKHFAEADEIYRHLDFLELIEYRNIDTSIRLWPALRNLFSDRSYNIERFLTPEFKSDILEELQDKPYDLIHFEGLFVAGYADGLECGIPKLLRPHNIEYRIWESLASTCRSGPKKWYLQLLSRRLERFERNILQRFDAVISITENDRKAINEMGFKGLSAAIPAGIEPPAATTTPTDYNTVYHVGSMEWMPNREAMEWFHTQIWPLIESRNENAVFHMGGKNMPPGFLQWQSKRFKVAGEINDLAAFTADKSILVVPLRSGSGIRIKTIEAMMAGKAVVTTAFGAAGLPLIHGEHCLIADTEADFALAIQSLLNDPHLRNTIAEKGRQFALAHYGNAGVCRLWTDLYARLLKSGPETGKP